MTPVDILLGGRRISLDQYLGFMSANGQAWAASDGGQIPVVVTGYSPHNWGPWLMGAFRWPPQTIGVVIPNHAPGTVTIMAYNSVEEIPWLDDPQSQ